MLYRSNVLLDEEDQGTIFRNLSRIYDETYLSNCFYELHLSESLSPVF